MKKILSAFVALLILAGCNSNESKVEATATTDGKAIVECIMTRTSIRQYTDQTVSADTIETLLRAGMAGLLQRSTNSPGIPHIKMTWRK